jgi:hypothetical protein
MFSPKINKYIRPNKAHTYSPLDKVKFGVLFFASIHVSACKGKVLGGGGCFAVLRFEFSSHTC